MKDILVIEPFHGGSHAQLIDLLSSDEETGPRLQVYTCPAKKWHWKARTSALYFSQVIEPSLEYKSLFCSSVLNLAELVSLRPDLAKLVKIVYFHENQLIYPIQNQQDRDFQYGYNQILTAMVADEVIFNSEYNKTSFLTSISRHLKIIPDHRPKNLGHQIQPKCKVLYFPLEFSLIEDCTKSLQQNSNANNKLKNNVHTSSSLCDGSKISSSSSIVFNSSSTLCMLTQNESEMNSQNLYERLLDDKNVHGATESEHEFQNLPEEATRGSCNQRHLDFSLTKSDSKSDSDFAARDSGEIKLVNSETPQRQMVIPYGGPRISPNSPSLSLHIVWPHRWEHDKGPESFFDALFHLEKDGLDFQVSVIGETFSEIPDVFHLAKSKLGPKIHAWGYQTREDYIKIISSAHVVVSTAEHEFFGVSMLEATSYGCYPLCPKRLVYPEIYPDECLYSTQAQLIKRLKQFCKRPDKIKSPFDKINFDHYSWSKLRKDYRKLLLRST